MLDTILPPDFLEEFKQAQFIIQSARKATSFRSLHDDFPFTLYRYRIYEDDDFGAFDLTTNLFGQSIAVRLGSVGMVFVNDGGLQYEAGKDGPLGLDGSELHPVEFSEVASRVHYKATLRDATHSYSTVETPDEIFVEQSSVRPFSNVLLDGGQLRIFRPWDDIECAKMIARYRQVDWGPVYDAATGLFSTTLSDEDDGRLPSPNRIARRV